MSLSVPRKGQRLQFGGFLYEVRKVCKKDIVIRPIGVAIPEAFPKSKLPWWKRLFK